MQLVLRVLLEAPNHESYPQEISRAIGLDDDDVAPVLRCFEEVGLIDTRDGQADRLYYRLTAKGLHIARYTMRAGDLTIRAERT